MKQQRKEKKKKKKTKRNKQKQNKEKPQIEQGCFELELLYVFVLVVGVPFESMLLNLDCGCRQFHDHI